jgi:hypothetical protein
MIETFHRACKCGAIYRRTDGPGCGRFGRVRATGSDEPQGQLPYRRRARRS